MNKLLQWKFVSSGLSGFINKSNQILISLLTFLFLIFYHLYFLIGKKKQKDRKIHQREKINPICSIWNKEKLQKFEIKKQS